MEHRTAVVVATLLLVAAGATTATVSGAATGADGPAADGTTEGAAAGPERGVAADRPATAPGLAGSPPGESIRDQVDTDRIRLTVDVRSDGTARWTVRYVTELDDENTSEAFESLRADIQANPGDYADRFAARIENTVRAAENATGREMTAREFSVEARTDQLGGCPPQYGCGVITYTYEWTNFAQVRDGGDRLVVGDAIEGYFLDGQSTMVVSWPEGYERASVEPEPDATNARSVSWSGEQNFLPGQPRLVVDASPSGTTTTALAGGDGGDGGGDGGGAVSPTAVAVVLVVLAVGGGAFYFVRSREPPEPADQPGADADPTGSGDGSPGDAGAAAAGDAPEGDGSQPAAADGDDGAEDEGAEPAIDEELLSNEERVLRLLEERGGRIKQQEVVRELGWTEAKTSQVVSGMREEGAIDGFRLGRENVLTLPDVDEGPLPGGDGDGDDGEGDDGGGDDGGGDGRSWGDT